MKKMLKGFTLVEIMIVVAIIAILAAVAIPNFVRYRKTSQMNACISNLKQSQGAVEEAKTEGKTTHSWTDIIGSDKYIKVTPKCPGAGTYDLPNGDTDNPTCSISTGDYVHALPSAATATST